MADGMQHPIDAETAVQQEQFMRWSETRSEIAKALAKAQATLSPVLKDSTNPHFGNKYAELSTVLSAVMPALNSNGISLIQAPTFNGASVAVTTMLLHESGEWMETTLKMKPSKTDPQGVGSCITYARRYSALAIAGAAPDDDDGNFASQRQAPQGVQSAPPREAKANHASKADSRDLYKELQESLRSQTSIDHLKEWARHNKARIEKLPPDWADELRKEYAAELEGHKNFNEREQADV